MAMAMKIISQSNNDAIYGDVCGLVRKVLTIPMQHKNDHVDIRRGYGDMNVRRLQINEPNE